MPVADFFHILNGAFPDESGEVRREIKPIEEIPFGDVFGRGAFA
jgi:hypothetical protein